MNDTIRAFLWVLTFLLSLVWFLVGFPSFLNAGDTGYMFTALVIVALWFTIALPFLVKNYELTRDLILNFYKS